MTSFFVLRAPLLSLDGLAGWAAAPPVPPSATPADVQQHLVSHTAYLRESYRALLADPVVREAIFVASPDLDTALESWLREPDTPRSRDVERALTRYLTRMASRPTPFGLFGSVAAGHAADTTSLAVAPHAECRRHTRLDIDYLNQVVEALIADPAIRPSLRYRPADTVCRIAGSWRYVETRVKDKARSHHLVSIEDNHAVSTALERAVSGATEAELAAAVRARGVREAEAFAAALVDSRVLQPDLACPVTGDAPADALARRLASIPGTEVIATALTDATEALRAIDAGPLAAGAAAYHAIAKRLGRLPAKVELARLFQVDAVRPPGATLSSRTLGLLRQGGELLLDLCPGGPDDEELERLRRVWAERFDEREVPLLEAIDADSGVGPALGTGARGSSALLDGLTFPETSAPTVPWGARQTHLLSLIVRAAASGSMEVELGDDDLRLLRAPAPVARGDAFAVHATLIGDRGVPWRVLVHTTIDPPVARHIGRFCHLDPAIADGVRGIIAAEEALEPDAVHAEIVHLPDGRAGNVILRPVLRTHEIPAMGASGAEPGRQISLSDLTVQLVGERFVLRSRRLARRVVPRMTTAHNFAGWGVGAYRFLCLVQADGQRGSAYWSWGPLAASPFLPRVRVGDVVLSRARWQLSKADIRSLQQPDMAGRWMAMRQQREAWRLPRWVVLGDGDNELVVDLDNALAVDSLVQLLKERDAATLLEWYPGAQEAVALGPGGSYAHELIVPFVPSRRESGDATAGPRGPAPRTRTSEAQRSFSPGSEWVFAKVYGGTATADRLLLQVVGPTGRALEEKGAIDRWFFIRYADPGEHIRWRLHVAPDGSVARVRRTVERALAAAVGQQLAWRVSFDTYEREVERYGGPEGVQLAEQWFHADSAAALDVLQAVEDDGDLHARWQATLLGIDRLLGDLGLDLAAKARLVHEARGRFGAEFRVDAAFRRSLADRLRPVARALEALLVDGPPSGTVLALADAAFARRRQRSRRAVATLRRLDGRGRLQAQLPSQAASYMHMMVNRLVRSEARMHELVLYDFLAQTYARQLARART